MSINRIDPTPVQISNNVSIARQGAKKDFGDRLSTGSGNGVVSNGAAVVGSALPGGAIVSAAVSQTGHASHGGTPGTGGGAVAASYGATGVVTLGGGGGVNTTVGGGGTGTGGVTMGTTVGAGGTATSGTNFIPSSGDSTLGDMNQQLIQSQSENAEMMSLQVQMQQENTVFTSVSNVLKTRQDTAKNSISNIR